MNEKIGIIDVGIGNVKSIQNMIYACGYDSHIIKSRDELKYFTKVILPGVGSFDAFMLKLMKYDFVDSLRNLISQNKIIILGICLGMHVLFNNSEEGNLNGLSVLDGKIEKLNLKDKKIKIPHNGWNEVKVKKNTNLFKINENLRFYFNHSYFLKSLENSNIVTITEYNQKIISGIEKNNIIGVQFHPEKSHNYGKTFFKRFIQI